MDKAGRIAGRVERDPFATVLAPCPPERLRRWPVGTAVNATRHDGPDLMAPVTLPAARTARRVGPHPHRVAFQARVEHSLAGAGEGVGVDQGDGVPPRRSLRSRALRTRAFGAVADPSQ